MRVVDKQPTAQYETPTGNLIGEQHVDRYRYALFRLFDVEATSQQAIGRGAHGKVFKMTLDNSMKSAFLRKKFTYKHSRPEFQDQTTVMVKIMLFKDSERNPGYRSTWHTKAAFREYVNHINLSDQRPITLTKNGVSKTFDVKSVIPREYASAIDMDQGFCAIIMEWIDGITLDSYLKTLGKKKLPAWIAYKLEYAILCIWLSGVLHGDLHANNVIVNVNTQKVYIIDFGMVITLVGGYVDKMNSMLTRSTGIKDFWSLVQNVSDAAAYQRFGPGKFKYHANSILLDFVNKRASTKNLAEGRQRTWGLWV